MMDELHNGQQEQYAESGKKKNIQKIVTEVHNEWYLSFRIYYG